MTYLGWTITRTNSKFSPGFFGIACVNCWGRITQSTSAVIQACPYSRRMSCVQARRLRYRVSSTSYQGSVQTPLGPHPRFEPLSHGSRDRTVTYPHAFGMELRTIERRGKRDQRQREGDIAQVHPPPSVGPSLWRSKVLKEVSESFDVNRFTVIGDEWCEE